MANIAALLPNAFQSLVLLAPLPGLPEGSRIRSFVTDNLSEKELILLGMSPEAAIASMQSAKTNFDPSEAFRKLHKLNILILHGSHDTTLPVSSSKKLAEILSPQNHVVLREIDDGHSPSNRKVLIERVTNEMDFLTKIYHECPFGKVA